MVGNVRASCPSLPAREGTALRLVQLTRRGRLLRRIRHLVASVLAQWYSDQHSDRYKEVAAYLKRMNRPVNGQTRLGHKGRRDLELALTAQEKLDRAVDCSQGVPRIQPDQEWPALRSRVLRWMAIRWQTRRRT